MTNHNQDGAVNVLVAVVLGLLLVVALGFAGWSFVGRQDYKNNTDAKVAVAVKVAKQQESTAKDAQFAEELKNPLRTYNGPQAFGSLIIKYPNTWSGYVDASGSDAPLNGYFYPGIVPSVSADSSIFALRVQVSSEQYSQVVDDVTSVAEAGEQTISAYSLPNVTKTVGVKVTGKLPEEKTGILVILPLRNQTVKIWTEGNQFSKDFNEIILNNFSFSP